MGTEAERRARARERAGRIVIRKTYLGDDTDPAPVSGQEGVSLCTRLTRESWRMSAREMPDTPRAELTFRFVPRTPS